MKLTEKKIKQIEELFDLKYKNDSNFYKIFIGKPNLSGYYRKLIITNYSVTYLLSNGIEIHPECMPLDKMIKLGNILGG